MSITVDDVAEWMLEELEESDYLYQEVVAAEILDRFGEEFVYYNQNGNLAISREVLARFRELTEETVVWDRSERLWRWREDRDPPDRRQADS